MANKSITDLRTASLQLSNYEGSDFVETPELDARINEAVSAYYDLVLSSRETYFRESFPFSLAGGFNSNTVALPSDLYKVQALDWNPGTSSVQVVPTLPSFRERHSIGRRCYDWTPGTLTVYPPQTSAGNYELLYTPTCPVLAAPVVVERLAPTLTPIGVTEGDDNVAASTGVFSFEVGFFSADAVGGCLVIAGAANAQNNGTFRITEAYPDLATTQLKCQGFFIDETFGAGVTASYSNAPIDGTLGTTWTLGNADLDDSYVGATVTITGSQIVNGDWTIATVLSPTTFTTTFAPEGDEIFGAGVSASFQLANTLYRLPDTLQSGALWIELFVADGILDKAEEDTSSIKMRLGQQTKRIQDSLRWKQDEPKQIPLVRRRYGFGWGF